jgi:hypothetical protein
LQIAPQWSFSKVTTRPNSVKTEGRWNSTEGLNIKRRGKSPEGRPIALKQTLHGNKEHRKRSFEKTEVDIKVSLLGEAHKVGASIEDTGSMYRKEMTLPSDRLFNNTAKNTGVVCERDNAHESCVRLTWKEKIY